jgi:hypothetical protein
MQDVSDAFDVHVTEVPTLLDRIDWDGWVGRFDQEVGVGVGVDGGELRLVVLFPELLRVVLLQRTIRVRQGDGRRQESVFRVSSPPFLSSLAISGRRRWSRWPVDLIEIEVRTRARTSGILSEPLFRAPDTLLHVVSLPTS